MAKVCAYTVVSADRFQYWLPLWLYAVKAAYPEWDAKVLITGVLLDGVRKILELAAFREINNYQLLEQQFEGYRLANGSYGALRFLIPKHLLRPYKYAYIGDVDLLVFRCNPSHVAYHRAIMKRAKVPYSSFRGPYNRPWRRSVHKEHGWRNQYTRVVGGLAMLQVEPWIHKTAQARKLYAHIAQVGGHDRHDKHRFGSYREYDEVMFGRMLAMSGLSVPQRKWQMPDGSRFDKQYRGIHVGDYRRKRRYGSTSRMRPYVHARCVRAFKRLMEDDNWKTILWHCCRGTIMVRAPIRNLRHYVK